MTCELTRIHEHPFGGALGPGPRDPPGDKRRDRVNLETGSGALRIPAAATGRVTARSQHREEPGRTFRPPTRRVTAA